MEHSDGLQWTGTIDKDLQEHMDRGQLPMFMTPNEILATYKPNDRKILHTNHLPWDGCDKGCVPETDDQVYKRKLSESWNYKVPLDEDIEENGVQNPVDLVSYKDHTGKIRRYVGNGHHRVVAAHSVKPDSLIPVQHLS